MYVHYQIHNLSDLLEAAQAIINEVQAEEEISSIDPTEILVGTKELVYCTLTLTSQTLTDGSKVYNVEAN